MVNNHGVNYTVYSVQQYFKLDTTLNRVEIWYHNLLTHSVIYLKMDTIKPK